MTILWRVERKQVEGTDILLQSKGDIDLRANGPKIKDIN